MPVGVRPGELSRSAVGSAFCPQRAQAFILVQSRKCFHSTQYHLILARVARLGRGGEQLERFVGAARWSRTSDGIRLRMESDSSNLIRLELRQPKS